MTRVLHIISGLGVGGAERMLVEVAGALAARGFHQHVVSLTGNGPNGEDLRARGIPVTVYEIRSWAEAFRGVHRLRRLVAELRPDVIQGWMYHGDAAAALAHRLGAARAGRRLFWNLRASNMDASRYGGIRRWCARISGWPDAVIANSHAGAAFHVEQGYRPRRLEVIHNGVDTSRFSPDLEIRAAVRAELGVPASAMVAINVARVDPMKDHGSFIQAVGQLPQVWGVMVGADTEKMPRPANVIALGVRRDVARLYAAADLVVSTSVFGEGFSNVLAEGMCSGLIPVATDVGDARLIVGDVGRVVSVGDTKALAGVIAALTEMPQEDRRALGSRARERILAQFPISRAVDAFAELYSSPRSGT